MSLASMADALIQAQPGGLAAFNVIQIEHAEALVAAAEDAGRPVVLQISQNCVRYHGDLTPLGVACLRIAATTTATVVVHLDHATRRHLVEEAVSLGFPSVMFDASALPYGENESTTAEVTTWCHRRGVWVEAELGEIGGKDGVHAPGARTDPDQAAAFCTATDVDALAVAVGSSHAMVTRDATLDQGLIATLRGALDVPLVLHGSSGVPDDQLQAAVRNGIAKVNIATHLNKVLTDAVRRRLAEDPALVDPRRYLGAGRDAVRAEARRLLDLLGDPA